MSAVKYWLWLSTASRLTPRVREQLLQYYGSPENIFDAPPGELTSLAFDCPGIETLEKRDISGAMRILDVCASRHIDIITIQDAAYPSRLRTTYSPPPVLYVKGKLPPVDDEVTLSVIGTRSASEYGIRMGMKLGGDLAAGGAVLVSGLTRGIEAAAVEGALRESGRCIGVLGTAHEDAKGLLYDELAVRGALVSEYPPGTEPQRSFFRARNRITAGLSLGVVVVEAPIKSGTQLFVAEALNMGRGVFAVPGNADLPSCEGTNAMLKDGAIPVTKGWDVLQEYEAQFPGKLRRQNPSRIKVPTLVQPEEPTKTELDRKEEPEYIDIKKQLAGLSETQLKIVECIGQDGTHVDEIIEQSGLSSAKVLAELTMLQLMGHVRQESGKRFALNIITK